MNKPLKKIEVQMTDQEIIQIQKKARYVAKKRGYSQLADDFSQEIIIHYLTGSGAHQTVEQYFIDYLRKLYGRSRDGVHRGRFEEQRNYVELTEVRNLAQLPADVEPPRRTAYSLKRKEYQIYQLYLNGWNLKEIGSILGLSESRICQKMRPIEKAIQNEAILQEGFERMEWDCTYLSYQVDWISM